MTRGWHFGAIAPITVLVLTLALRAGADDGDAPDRRHARRADPAVQAPVVLWKATVGAAGVSAPPALHGGHLVIGTGWGGMTLAALHPATGVKSWETRLDDNGVGAVVADGERVYVTTESCTIYSIPTETGRIAWKRWLGDPVLSSPSIVGQRIYVGSGAQRDGKFFLLCLDKRTGSTLWRAPIGAEITATPTVAADQVLVTLGNGVVAAFRLDGRRLWESAVAASSPPTRVGDAVFVNTEDGRTLACLDPADGRTRWSHTLTESRGTTVTQRGLFTMASMPVASGSNLFVGSGDGAMHCLRMRDGKAVWRTEVVAESVATDTPIPQMPVFPLGTPVPTHGRVYVGGADRHLYCLDAADGHLLWELPVDGGIRWAPIVNRGTIYFATDAGTAYAVDSGDPKSTGWTQWGGNAAHTMTQATSTPGGRQVVDTPADEDEPESDVE